MMCWSSRRPAVPLSRRESSPAGVRGEESFVRARRGAHGGEANGATGGIPTLRSEILAAYEQTLDSHMCPLNRASVLPFSKETIRKAIRDELTENPSHELRDLLEMAFVHLESFVPCDEYELVENFKEVCRAAQRMTRSGRPRDILESWSQARRTSGDRAVKVLENISERMQRRLKEVRAIGARPDA